MQVEVLRGKSQANTIFSKLRLTKKEVCEMLSVTRDKLSKMEKDDLTFPRSMKDGKTRQSAVYFDYHEIMDWYLNWKENNRASYS